MFETIADCAQVQSIDQYMFIWRAAVDSLTQLKEFEDAKASNHLV